MQPGASFEESKAAYKRLALQWRPEKAVPRGISREVAEAKFKDISRAYEILAEQFETNQNGSTSSRPAPTCSDLYDLFRVTFAARHWQPGSAANKRTGPHSSNDSSSAGKKNRSQGGHEEACHKKDHCPQKALLPPASEFERLKAAFKTRPRPQRPRCPQPKPKTKRPPAPPEDEDVDVGLEAEWLVFEYLSQRLPGLGVKNWVSSNRSMAFPEAKMIDPRPDDGLGYDFFVGEITRISCTWATVLKSRLKPKVLSTWSSRGFSFQTTSTRLRKKLHKWVIPTS